MLSGKRGVLFRKVGFQCLKQHPLNRSSLLTLSSCSSPRLTRPVKPTLSPLSLGQAATTSCLDLHNSQFHAYLFPSILHPSQTLLFPCLKLFSGFPSRPNPLEIPTRPCMVWLLPISLHASAAYAYSIFGSVPNSPNSPFPASEPIPTGPTAP